MIEGFSVSGASLEKLTPFEGPLEHVFYSEQARILGEILITSDTQITPPLWQKVKKT